MSRVVFFTLAVFLLVSSATAQQNSVAKQAPLLITHVAVIDVAKGQAQPDRTVVILGGYITEIGESSKIPLPADSQVVDATGKFLIPGLWDAHYHIAHEYSAKWARQVSLPLLIANGVTGIRDMGGDFELIKSLRNEIAAGGIPGPRIIAAGPQLIGTSKDSVQFLASNNADAARLGDSFKASWR